MLPLFVKVTLRSIPRIIKNWGSKEISYYAIVCLPQTKPSGVWRSYTDPVKAPDVYHLKKGWIITPQISHHILIPALYDHCIVPITKSEALDIINALEAGSEVPGVDIKKAL